MSLQDIDTTFQFGEDPPWADDNPMINRIQHQASGLYCEHGHGSYQRETHIFLAKNDNVPIQICKSAIEVAAFLGGYSRAVAEYLPIIIAAISLSPKGGPCYKLLDEFIYRYEVKNKINITPEPEMTYADNI